MDQSQLPDLGVSSGAVPAPFAVVLVLVGLFGLAVVAGGVRSVLRVEGRRTTGVVVDSQAHSRHERRTTFAPVVRFEADGRDVVVVGDQRWNRSFVPGRPAEVLYDPATPDRAHVRAEGGSVLGDGAGGVLLTVCGVAFLMLVGVLAALVRSVF